MKSILVYLVWMAAIAAAVWLICWLVVDVWNVQPSPEPRRIKVIREGDLECIGTGYRQSYTCTRVKP